MKIFARRNRVARFVAVVLCLGFAPHVYDYMRTTDRIVEVFRDTPRDDYLASLHNSIYPGCMMATVLQPDVLIVGDSHAYAAMDYVEAARLLKPKTIGACALPGAYFDSMLLLSDWLSRSPYSFKHLIYFVSPRQLATGEDNKMRVEQHRKILFDREFGRRQKATWVRNYDNGDPAFGRSAVADKAAFEKHATKINALNNQRILEVLLRNRAPHVQRWGENIRTWTFPKDRRRQIDAFCKVILLRGITLHVIESPESPLAELAYPEVVTHQYRSLKERFTCASTMKTYSASDAGLDNRHFVNRMFADDFDYSIWNQTNLNLDIKAWQKLFDLDHPNRLGAKIFTHRLISDIFGKK